MTQEAAPQGAFGQCPTPCDHTQQGLLMAIFSQSLYDKGTVCSLYYRL